MMDLGGGSSSSSKTATLYRRILASWNWTLIAVTVVVNFVPFFVNGAKWLAGEPVGNFAFLQASLATDKTTLTSSEVYAITADDAGYFQINRGPRTTLDALYMGMAIPAAMDLVVELVSSWTEKGDKDKHIVRLSWAERVVFCLGVLVYGAYHFVPTSWDIMFRSNLNWICTTNSTVLTVGPILIFLERHTSAFSATWTAFLVTLVSIDTPSNLCQALTLLFSFSSALCRLFDQRHVLPPQNTVGSLQQRVQRRYRCGHCNLCADHRHVPVEWCEAREGRVAVEKQARRQQAAAKRRLRLLRRLLLHHSARLPHVRSGGFVHCEHCVVESVWCRGE